MYLHYNNKLFENIGVTQWWFYGESGDRWTAPPLHRVKTHK